MLYGLKLNSANCGIKGSPVDPAGATWRLVSTPVKPNDVGVAVGESPPQKPLFELSTHSPKGRSPKYRGSDSMYPTDMTALPRPSSKFAPRARSARNVFESPFSVIPSLTWRSMPAKFFLVMKFTTPETASAP